MYHFGLVELIFSPNECKRVFIENDSVWPQIIILNETINIEMANVKTNTYKSRCNFGHPKRHSPYLIVI